jgi:NDP-sugar pyrophosphorylase family protein
MAGGKGIRLQPITLFIPKPLLPFNDKTVLEAIIERITGSGIDRIFVSIGHMGRFVKTYLEGTGYRGKCEFVEEASPLGTAGPLALLPLDVDTVLVNNCDILTDLSYVEFLAFHRSQNADCTIVGAYHDIQLPYGGLNVDEELNLIEWVEGEKLTRLVSGGIYLVERAVIDLVGTSRPLDMPQLVQEAVRHGLKVRVFPHKGVWFDIGDLVQYENTVTSIKNVSLD